MVESLPILKLVVVGESNTGKTCLMMRFIEDRFEDYGTTIGTGFKIHSILFKGKKYKLQIWDTAGQERFRKVTKLYLEKAHGIILVYSLDDAEPYESCLQWYQFITEHNKEVPIILAQNKSDIESAKESLKNPLEEYSVPMIAVSAKTGLNVNHAFMTIIDMILKKNPKAGQQEAVQEAKPPDFLVHYDEHKPEEKTTEDAPIKVKPSNEAPCCCVII